MIVIKKLEFSSHKYAYNYVWTVYEDATKSDIGYIRSKGGPAKGLQEIQKGTSTLPCFLYTTCIRKKVGKKYNHNSNNDNNNNNDNKTRHIPKKMFFKKLVKKNALKIKAKKD